MQKLEALRLSLFYAKFDDAFKEGDGEWLIRSLSNETIPSKLWPYNIMCFSPLEWHNN